jgi:hypothetical protein
VSTGSGEVAETVEGPDVVAAVAPEELSVELEIGSEEEMVLLLCVEGVTRDVVVTKDVVVTEAVVVVLRGDTVPFPLLECSVSHDEESGYVFVNGDLQMAVDVLLVELVVVFMYDEASLLLAHIWNMFA